VKGKSAQCLVNFKPEEFDFIYIDGSHFYDDVLIDTLLSWNALKINGFMVWDDYLWTRKALYGKLNPKLAIDQFLTAHSGEYEIVFSGYQVAVQKTSSLDRPS
jgi:hypothetical protein